MAALAACNQEHCSKALCFTCQHALDRLLCEALCILELLGGHGVGPVDVTVDDGGPHVAGAVALHPAVLCEDKALHSLAKVFNPAERDTSLMNTQLSPGQMSRCAQQLLEAQEIWGCRGIPYPVRCCLNASACHCDALLACCAGCK